jgi:hypothetical protein
MRNSHRRWQARRALFALSDAALKDIGLQRLPSGAAIDLMEPTIRRTKFNQ